MLRLTLTGDELDGFTSLSPDDHIKVFSGGVGGAELERRDYTPRRYDPRKGELDIDFAMHDAGPITDWARMANPGDAAEIGGPRGSAVVPYDFDWWLLIGDETALPAIGRRLEEMPAGTLVTSIIAVTDGAEEQSLPTKADARTIWVHRPAARDADAAPLLSASKAVRLPPGEGFIWIAAEAGVTRALRRYVLEDLKHPARWMKASGYWVKGLADTVEKFDD